MLMRNKEDIDIEYLDMMLDNFKYATTNNLDTVYFGYSYIDENFIYQYWVDKIEWSRFLDLLIDGAVELEEYEYAHEFKNIKKSIN